MDKEKDDFLCKTFPLLYKDRHASAQVTCMCWGFDVGIGWYDIVYRLSEKLEALIAAQPEDDRAYASQVKEKFGILRFYMDGNTTKEMEAAIREAEVESAKTCEVCGKPGGITGKGWLTVLCEEHRKK